MYTKLKSISIYVADVYVYNSDKIFRRWNIFIDCSVLYSFFFSVVVDIVLCLSLSYGLCSSGNV
jgi:hypothetical protein